jgi:hypothetical protein
MADKISIELFWINRAQHTKQQYYYRTGQREWPFGLCMIHSTKGSNQSVFKDSIYLLNQFLLPGLAGLIFPNYNLDFRV